MEMKKIICSVLALFSVINVGKLEEKNKKNEYKKSINVGKKDNYKYQLGSPLKYEGKVDEFEFINVEEKIEANEIEDENEENINMYNCDTYTIRRNLSFSSNYFVDNNEDNDSFEKASAVYSIGENKKNFRSLGVSFSATISKKTSGWWIFSSTYIDKDFYSYDVYCRGTMTIKLGNVPKECDYDIRLYKMSNTISTSYSELDFDAYYEISNSGLKGEDERIEVECEPGTYFIAVYSYKDQTYDNDNPYCLSITQSTYNYMNRLSDYSIGKARENGDLGAVWLSDYNPFGYHPMSLSNPNAYIHFGNYYTYPYIKHLSDNYSEESILYAEVFVWDVGLRACLYETFTKILESIESYKDWSERQSKIVNIIFDGTNILVSIGGVTTSILSATAIAASAAGLLTGLGIGFAVASLALSITSICLSYSKEEYSVSKAELREYIIDIRRAMEVGIGSTNKEVKTIKFRYRFKNNDTLDYSPKFIIEDNIYNNDIIPYNLEGSAITGKVDGFSSNEQIEGILKYAK